MIIFLKIPQHIRNHPVDLSIGFFFQVSTCFNIRWVPEIGLIPVIIHFSGTFHFKNHPFGGTPMTMESHY